MVPKGSMAGMSPAKESEIPYLSTISLVANLRKGNTPE